LVSFCDKLTDYPTFSRENIFFQGKEYLAVGFTGKKVSGYSFVALFPLEKIERQIRELKIGLFFFLLVSILFTFFLSRFLSARFLIPISHLTTAAKAIEKRTFEFQLPDLGANEFGKLGKFFNRVILGTEELQIAKIVQEELFPQEGFSLKGFKVYGKSTAMGDVGGDYFDYFRIDDASLGIVIGDVSGHGVPAGIVMAMVKTWFFLNSDKLEQPSALMSDIHSLLRRFKRKSSFSMSMQYLLLDSSSRRGIICNAGHCNPILIHIENSEKY